MACADPAAGPVASTASAPVANGRPVPSARAAQLNDRASSYTQGCLEYSCQSHQLAFDMPKQSDVAFLQ